MGSIAVGVGFVFLQGIRCDELDESGSLVPRISDYAPVQRIRRNHFTTHNKELLTFAPLSPRWIEDG